MIGRFLIARVAGTPNPNPHIVKDLLYFKIINT